MSNRELDNLFKTKLEDLERKPSANAWDRIQAGKQQKKGKGIWFYSSIAAAVVLLIASAGVFLLNNDNTATTTGITALEDDVKQKEAMAAKEVEEEKLSLQKSESSQQLAVDNEQNSHSEEAIISKDNKDNKKDLIAHSSQAKAVSKANKGESSDKDLSKTRNQEPKTKNSELKTENQELNIENTEPKTLNSHATNSTTVASTNQQPKEQDKGQTITFNIEDFKAATTVAKAAEKEEKRSPLKKVVDFAKNLKEGDAGLGELREAKNELFALNFKKENDNSK